MCLADLRRLSEAEKLATSTALVIYTGPIGLAENTAKRIRSRTLSSYWSTILQTCMVIRVSGTANRHMRSMRRIQ